MLHGLKLALKILLCCLTSCVTLCANFIWFRMDFCKCFVTQKDDRGSKSSPALFLILIFPGVPLFIMKKHRSAIAMLKVSNPPKACLGVWSHSRLYA